MIRLRSQKLLSGVSTVAMLAAFGAADPALAGQTIASGTNPNPAVVNAGADNFINITPAAVVLTDGSGRSVINTGTLTNAAADTININAAVLTGQIFNAGTLSSTNDDGIDINSNSVVAAGGLFNSGWILGGVGDQGVEINTSVFIGGITNSGAGSRIIGAADGILITGDTVFTGGITNDGTIAGTAGRGIRINDALVDFVGNITNNTGGTISAVGANAIDLSAFSTFTGNISNSGLITFTGAFDGISIDAGVFTGSIINTQTGTISTASSGNGFGIDIENAATVTGDIINAGRILADGGSGKGIEVGGRLTGEIQNDATGTISANGGAGIGIHLFQATGTITNGIDNAGRILANGATGQAIAMTNGSLAGGIENTGTISATGAGGQGIVISGGTFAGGIQNLGANSLIQADGSAIAISLATFGGGITNQGDIISTTADAINITSATAFNGNITNAAGASISAVAGNGINVNNGAQTFTGTVTNSGDINALTDAINMNVATLNGHVVNAGTGVLTATNDDGIAITATTMTGNVTNAGNIGSSTTAVGGTGIELDITTHTGTITNSGSIFANAEGIELDGTTLNGNIVNDGFIHSNTNDGIEIDVATINGDVVNNGQIGSSTSAVGDAGLDIDGTTLTGSVTNTGSIFADDDGIVIQSGLTVTGDVTNDGFITADVENAGAGSGIDIQGIVQGTLVNTGTILGIGSVGNTGVNVEGQIDGGIDNSGHIIGTDRAIDLSGADTATTITHTAGLIQGRNTSLVIPITTALDLNNAFADTFNADGGVLDGDVIGNGTDSFYFGGANFTYLRGTASGIDHFDTNVSGTYLLGAAVRGVDGEGVTVGADHFRVLLSGSPTIYLDDDTTITLVNDLNLDYDGGSAATVEFFLREGTQVASAADYGSIASGAVGNLGTTANLSVYLDPVTFAAPGAFSTYDYQNVITNIGADNFANRLDITTSSIFFTGTAVNDGANIDITLNRLNFADALAAAGATETQNQQAVAAALDAIYDNVAISPGFQSVFADLFTAGLTPAQIQFILNDLSGAEYAQLQQVSLSLAGNFNNLVEERLDAGLRSLGGARMAALQAQRYADAGTTASDGSHGMTRGASGTSVWLRGFGQWVNVDTDPEADGYDQDSNGLIGGVDHALNANAMVGGAVSYTDTDVDFDEAGDTADVESWQVGLYGSYGFGKFYLDGVASYAWHDVNAQRTITLPSATHVATAAYDASAWSAQAEVGAIWVLGRVNMQPSLALGYTGADLDGFTETVVPASPIGLVVSGSDSDSLATTLALRASGEWMMAKTRVVPDIKIGWRHEFEDGRQSFTANFLEDLTSAASMSIVSSEIQPDSMVVSTGATFGVTRNFEVFIDVNGQYNADASATNASGGVRLTW